MLALVADCQRDQGMGFSLTRAISTLKQETDCHMKTRKDSAFGECFPFIVGQALTVLPIHVAMTTTRALMINSIQNVINRTIRIIRWCKN
jgi:hypothetical protein